MDLDLLARIGKLSVGLKAFADSLTPSQRQQLTGLLNEVKAIIIITVNRMMREVGYEEAQRRWGR